MVLLFLTHVFAADPAYQEPPSDIQAILDADSPPAVMVSPDREWMLELERPNLRVLEELAQPEVKVAAVHPCILYRPTS